MRSSEIHVNAHCSLSILCKLYCSLFGAYTYVHGCSNYPKYSSQFWQAGLNLAKQLTLGICKLAIWMPSVIARGTQNRWLRNLETLKKWQIKRLTHVSHYCHITVTHILRKTSNVLETEPWSSFSNLSIQLRMKGFISSQWYRCCFLHIRIKHLW